MPVAARDTGPEQLHRFGRAIHGASVSGRTASAKHCDSQPLARRCPSLESEWSCSLQDKRVRCLIGPRASRGVKPQELDWRPRLQASKGGGEGRLRRAATRHAHLWKPRSHPHQSSVGRGVKSGRQAPGSAMRSPSTDFSPPKQNQDNGTERRKCGLLWAEAGALASASGEKGRTSSRNGIRQVPRHFAL